MMFGWISHKRLVQSLWVIGILLGSSSVAAGQLLPEIQADRYLLAARQAIERQDFIAAQAALNRMSLLETEKGLELPEEFYFRSAQVAQQTHRPERAVQMVTRYLEMTGREGEHYTDALELLNAAEANTFNAAQTCRGKPKGSECWMELDNQPDCYVWDLSLQPETTVTWTAECAESLAQGTGTLKWAWDGGKKTSKETGRLESGKYHGRWKERDSNGHVHEGPFEQGKQHGKWAIQWADDDGDLSGNRMEGTYVQGKRQGLWTARWTDGTIEKRPFIEGRIHGQLTGRNAAGHTWEISYVEGKKHGQFTRRTAEGKVLMQGPYVAGQKQGSWTNGVWKGAYVEDKRHGRWVRLNEKGRVTEECTFVEGRKHGSAVEQGMAPGGYWEKGLGSYKEGKRHGLWRWRNNDGTSALGSYVEGKEHGEWTIHDKDGVEVKGPYVKGKRHGRWVEHEDDGLVIEGSYVESKRHGTWLLYAKGEKESTLTSKLIYDNGSIAPIPIEPEMAVIQGGRFRMGSDRGHFGREKPVHTVRVEAFELSKFEVTFEEYDRFTAATGREWAEDEGWGRGRRPVINVSWEDAVAYTQWLSSKTGNRYRLPSEAEWEYAARAGKKNKKYSWGNEIGHNRANCRGCGSQWELQTAPVGSFAPNIWGLHDMHGNVAEWVQDCVNWKLSFGRAEGYWGAPTDGSAWESGNCSEQVTRSGSFLLTAVNARSAYRQREKSTDTRRNLGFRVARTVYP